MKKVGIILVLVCLITFSKGQVLIISPNYTYTQGFGTTAITAGVFATFTGWAYDGAINLEQNIGAPTNTGGRYPYTFGASNNRKIGSRASGGTGNIQFGVLFRNTSGQTIKSFSVNYSGFQVSQGGNTSAATNVLSFDYVISGATIPITAGGGIVVPALNYTQSQFVAVANTGSQGLGYPGSVSSNLSSGCLTIAANIPNNSYILLRWNDPNDPQNDCHFAIDDVLVIFFTNQTVASNIGCSTLPIELTNFTAKYNYKAVNINWTTANELNNNYFEVERSKDGINFEIISNLKAKGNSNQIINYKDFDTQPLKGISYYRLKQTDNDGTFTYSKIEVINTEKPLEFTVAPNPTNTGEILINSEYNPNTENKIEVLDYTGKLLLEEKVSSSSTLLKLNQFAKGIYLIRVSIDGNFSYKKIIYN